MPLRYKGIVHEHIAVRNKAGVFDISHMGRILISGPDAEEFLDFLSTNHIKEKSDGTAIYTVWCNEEGGSVDDVIVYKESPTEFFVIVNAANRQKDLDHILGYSRNYQVNIENRFKEDGILSLQGPLASEYFPEAAQLKHMHFMRMGKDLVVSRTGYTGSDGFEFYGPYSVVVDLWDRFLKAGVEPVGLGARDTLRLEMGYALYGHELTDTISPTESVAAWTVKDDKNFVGKAALKNKRHAYGIKMIDPGIPREKYPIYREGVEIGQVTSGTFSPSLNQGIALILVDMPLQIDEHVEVAIRSKLCRAQVASLPFIRSKL